MKITPKKIVIYRPGWDKLLCRIEVMFKAVRGRPYALNNNRYFHYISWNEMGHITFEQSFYTTRGYVSTLRRQLQIETELEYFAHLEPLAFMREMIKNG